MRLAVALDRIDPQAAVDVAVVEGEAGSRGQDATRDRDALNVEELGLEEVVDHGVEADARERNLAVGERARRAREVDHDPRASGSRDVDLREGRCVARDVEHVHGRVGAREREDRVGDRRRAGGLHLREAARELDELLEDRVEVDRDGGLLVDRAVGNADVGRRSGSAHQHAALVDLQETETMPRQ